MNNTYRCIVVENNPQNTEIVYQENIWVIIIFLEFIFLFQFLDMWYSIMIGGG